MKLLEELLEKSKNELEIEENIKIRVRDYKRLIASASIEKKIIRINRKILNKKFVEKKLGEKNYEKFIIKVLKHELMHIKLKTKWHVPQYFEDLI